MAAGEVYREPCVSLSRAVGARNRWLAASRHVFAGGLGGAESAPSPGYRAHYVDYRENGPFGKDGLDVVQHGPVMGVTFNWLCVIPF